MDDAYDREWTVRIENGDRRTRLRFALTTYRGSPVRFLVQLEYYHDGSWLEVARFDHDRDERSYADVRSDGLHLDVHRPDGTQHRKDHRFEPMSEKAAMSYAERFLKRRYDQLVTEFERWL